ncbi:hypothetical protein PIB30_082862 [Stylosanthes scabra]|uniref:Uncharacterized protein n=1 Tax=Stylosanthes scabra TaxID=79078 RepID=A0ABU6QSL9_9FABA|nr:hypothetical protein [Stylosanthes scabra]
MNKTPEEAWEMIETVADANQHFSTRATVKEQPWENCSRRAGRPGAQNHTQASQSQVTSAHAPRLRAQRPVLHAQAPKIMPRRPDSASDMPRREQTKPSTRIQCPCAKINA